MVVKSPVPLSSLLIVSNLHNTMDQLQAALSTMYSNASREQKIQANIFLETFQKSKEAWDLIHQILSDSTSDFQTKLFATQTLRSKITYDLSQLPESNYFQLKDSIIDFLIKYSSHEFKLIRTQLNIALSQLSLQFLNWSDALQEIINKLSSNLSQVSTLIEFLKILPEELSDVKKTSLSDEEFNQRTQDLITNNVEPVLLILKDLIEKSNNDVKINSLILDTLNSWIKECPIESVLQIDSFTTLIFYSLTVDETFDKSIECLVTILRETRDIENTELINALFKQLLQLNSFMQQNPDKLSDPEVVNGLTRLYVEGGESWHVLIAKNPTHFKPLVQILVDCCKYDEDLDVVKYTFYFWFLLKQLIVLPRYNHAKVEFTELYCDLVTVIIKHLTYPISQDDNLFDGDKEQEDKFKEFRYEMGDVLKDCCAVIGAPKALNIPFQQIQNILNSNQSNHWQHLEAPLFSMRAMAKEVSPKEKTILPTIMNFLIQLPEHPKIRYSATLVLGRYTRWTSKNPEFLEAQLNYIIKGFEVVNSNPTDALGNKDIVVSSSHALMYICQDCSSLLVNYLEQLYLLYGQIKDQLDIESTFELVDGLAHVIKQVPVENIYQTTEMFLTPTLDVIKKLINEPNSEENGVILGNQIEIISIFLTVLKCQDYEKPQFPVADLFIDKIWPIASEILSKFSQSLKVSERVCKLIKSAIQSFSTHLNRILGDLATTLHLGFSQTHFGCYLWVSGVLIREFGDEYTSEDVKLSVYDFGLTQCSGLFEFIFSANNDISQYPDVIEDFFRMMSDLLMFYPFKLIPNNELLTQTIKASIITLTTINEFDPLVACVHFLIDLISWGLPSPPISFFEQDTTEIKSSLHQFLASNNQGGELMGVVLNGLIFKFTNDLQQDANDLLLKLLIVLPEHSISVVWLSEVVKSLPNVDGREVTRLVTTVSTALSSKDNRRIRSALKDFVSWYQRKNISPRSEF